jgi:hypothetical protein
VIRTRDPHIGKVVFSVRPVDISPPPSCVVQPSLTLVHQVGPRSRAAHYRPQPDTSVVKETRGVRGPLGSPLHRHFNVLCLRNTNDADQVPL